MLSIFAALAFFAQLAAIIVTVFYGGELARKNVGRRFALASLMGCYGWASSTSAVLFGGASGSLTLGLVLLGGCTMLWFGAFIAGGCPFPGRIPVEERRIPWWRRSRGSSNVK